MNRQQHITSITGHFLIKVGGNCFPERWCLPRPCVLSRNIQTIETCWTTKSRLMCKDSVTVTARLSYREASLELKGRYLELQVKTLLNHTFVCWVWLIIIWVLLVASFVQSHVTSFMFRPKWIVMIYMYSDIVFQIFLPTRKRSNITCFCFTKDFKSAHKLTTEVLLYIPHPSEYIQSIDISKR